MTMGVYTVEEYISAVERYVEQQNAEMAMLAWESSLPDGKEILNETEVEFDKEYLASMS